MNIKTFVISGLILTLALSASASAQQGKLPPNARCFECGMKLDLNSHFIATASDANGRLHPYCDIGDMLTSYRDMKQKPAKLYVRDYVSGEWIDAKNAYYVKSDLFETPMSWGIAAFKNEMDAGNVGKPMAFEQALKEVE